MRVFVDARMAGKSGIGVVLEAVLRRWRDAPPPFDLTILGGGQAIRDVFAGAPMAVSERVVFVPWEARIYSPLAALKGVGSLGARRGDVFFSPHYATSLWPGVPLVSYVQDVIHWTHPPRPGTGPYVRAYLAMLRRRAAFTLTPSRHVKVQLQTLLGFDAARVLRVPLGPGLLHEGNAPSARAAAAFEPPGDGYLLALGLYKPHKNWDFLLDRLGGMWRDGAPVPRLVAGGLGPPRVREAFWRAVAEHGIADRVVPAPHLSPRELASLIAGARALVFPSLAEGFGLPILEAMGCGTPVVIADREPMTEVAGGAALTFDPDRPETLDEAVLALSGADVALRRHLAARGMANVARFSWERCAAQVADVLVRASDESLGRPLRPDGAAATGR